MSRRPKRTCEEPFINKGSYGKDLRNAVLENIKDFFESKSWFVGGPIPECELLADINIDLVLRTPFDEFVFNFIHQNCLPKVAVPKDFVDQGVPWTVTFLIKILNEMKSYNIPKDFQPGFVLLFFKLCKGVNVPLPPII